jgi:predicted transcriptional regulator
MSEYNQYVTAINKIFDYLNKMKVGWNSQDNLNYIESIEEYKQVVASNAEIFKTPVQEESNNLEALGDD